MARPTLQFTLEFKGVTELIQRLEAKRMGTEQAILQGLDDTARNIISYAQRNTVPENLTILSASGKTGKASKEGGDFVVDFGFGSGGAEDYALSVHEHPSSHSPPSWRGKSVSEILSVRTRTPWGLGSNQRGPKYLKRSMDRFSRLGEFLRVALSRAARVWGS